MDQLSSRWGLVSACYSIIAHTFGVEIKLAKLIQNMHIYRKNI